MLMFRRLCVTISFLLLLSACGAGSSATPTAADPPQLPRSFSAAQCHQNGELPDSKCTPGATNPAVTIATIHQTICVSGYTKTIRPPITYTDPLKRQQMQEYGYTDTLGNHEEDHLIPLELGGNPTDPKNLWPQNHAGKNGVTLGSQAKDRTENAAKAAVCSGAMTLDAAQKQMAADWTVLYNDFNSRGLLAAPLPTGESDAP